jgi:hypothetical protein
VQDDAEQHGQNVDGKDLLLALEAEAVDDERQVEDRRDAARARPAEEGDRRRVETRADQADRGRQHAHQGQTGERIARVARVNCSGL